jgi:16S rRNA G966 N2-methylase RsmD
MLEPLPGERPKHTALMCKLQHRNSSSSLALSACACHKLMMTNTLYYGDNLDVLREHLKDESVDLIYLDPPFNSNASYNILFKSPAGAGADASIEAFDDTWAWGPTASSALMDITQSGNHKLHVLMQAMKTAIGENAMMGASV